MNDANGHGPTNGSHSNGASQPFSQDSIEAMARNAHSSGPSPTMNEEQFHRLLQTHERVTANALMARQDFFNQLFDPRRNLEDECGYPRNDIPIAVEVYRQLFDRDPIARRACELMTKECFKVTPLIYEDESADVITPFEEGVDNLPKQLGSGPSWYNGLEGSPLWDVLARANILSGIGRFGVVLIGLDDGKNLMEPADGVVTLATNTQGKQVRVPDSLLHPSEEKLLRNGAICKSWQGRYEKGKSVEDEKLFTPLTANEKQQLEGWAAYRSLVNNKLAELRSAWEEWKEGQVGGLATNEQDGATTRDLDNLAANLCGDGLEGIAPEDRDLFNSSDFTLNADIDGTSSAWSPRVAVLNKAAEVSELMGTDLQYSWQGQPPTGTSVSSPGTDQQYFGIQFGKSETWDKKPAKGQHKVVFLQPFDESLVQVVRWEWNIRNPRFGMPVMYRITLNDPRIQHSGVGLPLATVFVHWSRVVHLAQDLTTSRVMGTPILQAILNPILDARKIAGASAEGYWQQCLPILSWETLPQLGGDVILDKEALKNTMEDVINRLQRYTISTGMTLKSVPPSVTDPTPYWNLQIERICIKIACPIRVFKGSERGEQASSQDDSSWNDRCKHHQTFFITPMLIVPLLDRLIQLGCLPPPGKGAKQLPTEESTDTADQANPSSQGGGGAGGNGKPETNPGRKGLGQRTQGWWSWGSGPSKLQAPAGGGKGGAPGSAPGAGGNPGAGSPATVKAPPGGSPAPALKKQGFKQMTTPTGNRLTVWERHRLQVFVVNAFGEPDVREEDKGNPVQPNDKVIGSRTLKDTVIEHELGYNIEWPDLDSMTGLEKAQVLAARTTAWAAYVAGGLEQVIPVHTYATQFDSMEEERAEAMLSDAVQAQQAGMAQPGQDDGSGQMGGPSMLGADGSADGGNGPGGSSGGFGGGNGPTGGPAGGGKMTGGNGLPPHFLTSRAGATPAPQEDEEQPESGIGAPTPDETADGGLYDWRGEADEQANPPPTFDEDGNPVEGGGFDEDGNPIEQEGEEGDEGGENERAFGKSQAGQGPPKPKVPVKNVKRDAKGRFAAEGLGLANGLIGKQGEPLGDSSYGAALSPGSVVSKHLEGHKFANKLSHHDVSAVLSDHEAIGRQQGASGRSEFKVKHAGAIRAVLVAAKTGEHEGKPVRDYQDLSEVAQAEMRKPVKNANPEGCNQYKACTVGGTKELDAKDLKGHPFAKMTQEQARQLFDSRTIVGPTAPSGNPFNYDLDNFPKGVDGPKLRGIVTKFVEEATKKNAFVRPNLADLYDHVKGEMPKLTLKDFQSSMAKMSKDRHVTLGEWTQTYMKHPDPKHLMPLDRGAQFYLQPGDRPVSNSNPEGHNQYTSKEVGQMISQDLGYGLGDKAHIHLVEEEDKLIHLQPHGHKNLFHANTLAAQFEEKHPDWNVVVRDPLRNTSGSHRDVVQDLIFAFNAFCATGKGGKVDPSCGKDDHGSGGGAGAAAGAGGHAAGDAHGGGHGDHASHELEHTGHQAHTAHEVEHVHEALSHGEHLLDAGAIVASHVMTPMIKGISKLLQKIPGVRIAGKALASLHEKMGAVADRAMKGMANRYGAATASAILGVGSVAAGLSLHGLGHAMPKKALLGALPLLAVAEVGKRLGLVGPGSKLEKGLRHVGSAVHAVKTGVGKLLGMVGRGLKGAAKGVGAAVRFGGPAKATHNTETWFDVYLFNEEDKVNLTPEQLEQAAQELMKQVYNQYAELLKEHAPGLNAEGSDQLFQALSDGVEGAEDKPNPGDVGEQDDGATAEGEQGLDDVEEADGEEAQHQEERPDEVEEVTDEEPPAKPPTENTLTKQEAIALLGGLLK